MQLISVLTDNCSVLYSDNSYKVSMTHLIRSAQMDRAFMFSAGDAEQQGSGRSCTVHGAERSGRQEAGGEGRQP